MPEKPDDDDRTDGYASPPCLMHETDPAWRGEAADESDRVRVLRWRKAERQRLIAARLAVDAGLRRAHAAAIADRLDTVIGDPGGKTVSVYWPFRGEPDLRAWMERVAERGGRCALPVVVKKAAPLVFRTWRRGEPLGRGVWDIPIPADGCEVVPDVVVSPLVGFDRGLRRLGYGGGFYDRTLAGLDARPLVVGVGYALAEIPTIYPQPHDIPMSVIVTEEETVRPPRETPGGTAA